MLKPDKKEVFEARVVSRRAKQLAKATKTIHAAQEKKKIFQYARTLRRVKCELDSFSDWCKKTQARVDKALYNLERDFRKGLS